VTPGDTSGAGPLSSFFMPPLSQFLSELDTEMQQQLNGLGLGEFQGLFQSWLQGAH
jgi:hypothetical protein